MKLKPIGDRIIARRVVDEQKKKNGLILPDSHQRRDRFEVEDNVLVCGVPLLCGDIIYAENYAGHEIKLDDEIFVVLKSEDVIAYESEA